MSACRLRDRAKGTDGSNFLLVYSRIGHFVTDQPNPGPWNRTAKKSKGTDCMKADIIS